MMVPYRNPVTAIGTVLRQTPGGNANARLTGPRDASATIHFRLTCQRRGVLYGAEAPVSVVMTAVERATSLGSFLLSIRRTSLDCPIRVTSKALVVLISRHVITGSAGGTDYSPLQSIRDRFVTFSVESDLHPQPEQFTRRRR